MLAFAVQCLSVCQRPHDGKVGCVVLGSGVLRRPIMDFTTVHFDHGPQGLDAVGQIRT